MANYSALSQNFETLLSSTLHKVLGTGAFADNVFSADPFLSWMRSGERVKVIDGGERIRVPILYEKSSAGGYYSGYDLLDTTAQEGHTTAFFNWKQIAYSVSVSGLELRSNSGSKEKINDVQDAKITQAAKSLSDTVATGVYSDGTASGVCRDPDGQHRMAEPIRRLCRCDCHEPDVEPPSPDEQLHPG
jgi:hypothetical protein